MGSLFKRGSLFKTGILGRVADALEPDRVLMEIMNGFIEATAVKRALDVDQESWKPWQPLKLLLAGYVSTRNTGADVRVEEMIRQFRHVVGDDELELTIMSINPQRTAGYFRTVRQVELPVVFPKFLFDECPKHHGVVACEGSMFKSKFASALSTMMAGALGMAAAENKLAVGYGAEAGAMSPALRDFVKRHCQHALVQCRNEPSREVLGRLGIRTTGGTDTAWTFEPAPLSEGARLLRERDGYEGEIRAVGTYIIDQVPMMTRVGIDAFATVDPILIAAFEKGEWPEVPLYLQPALDRGREVPAGTRPWARRRVSG